MIMEILAGIGAGVVIGGVLMLLQYLRDVFRNWRKNGCKIKLLCKPHQYEPDWLWPGSGELELKCKKCGKTKKLYVDVKAFNKWFGNL